MSKIPKLQFNENNPDVHFGQVSDVLIADIGYPLVSYEKSYLLGRISNDGDDVDAIRSMTVIGDKPAPETTKIDISHKRKVTTPKVHTLPFRMDETNDQNYAFLQELEQNGIVKVLIWLRTCSGKLIGGLSGTEASIVLDHVIPESNDELETFVGSLEWRGNHADRVDDPLAADATFVDTIKPIAAFIPADGAVGVAVNITMTIELSEAIRKVGGVELTDDNIADVLTFVDGLSAPVGFTATILYNKRKIIIVPDADLAADDYTLTLNGVEDYASNAFDVESSTFTTP